MLRSLVVTKVYFLSNILSLTEFEKKSEVKKRKAGNIMLQVKKGNNISFESVDYRYIRTNDSFEYFDLSGDELLVIPDEISYFKGKIQMQEDYINDRYKKSKKLNKSSSIPGRLTLKTGEVLEYKYLEVKSIILPQRISKKDYVFGYGYKPFVLELPNKIYL